MPSPEAFYPGRVAISAYGSDGFRFADMQHDGGLLILDDGIHRWGARTMGELVLDDFAEIFARAKPGAFLLLGTGKQIARPSALLRNAFDKAGIAIDFMDTGAAVRTWNVLIAEDRTAFCALLPHA